jgi:hypothetical protein
MRPAPRLHTTGTDAERLLLSAGFAERPDAVSVRNAAARLGVFPRAFLLSIAIAIAVRGMKWTSIAVGTVVSVGLASAAVSAYLATHRALMPAPIAAAASVPVAPSEAPGRSTMPSERAAENDIELRPPPSDRGERRAAGRAAVRPSSPAAAADSLREQARRLDHARALLMADDAAAALAALDDFDHRFPKGPLSEESLLLRIEGFAHRGERPAASSLARRFLALYPASVHAGRVSALLGALSQ